MFWMDAVVCRNKGGGWPADIAGFLPQSAHGLVMLFGQVVVTFQVPAPRKAQSDTRVRLYGSQSPSGLEAEKLPEQLRRTARVPLSKAPAQGKDCMCICSLNVRALVFV